MQLELLKVIVQVVLLERDEQGQVTGERYSDQTALYSKRQVAEFLDEVDAQIEAQNRGATSDGQATVPGDGDTVVLPGL